MRDILKIISPTIQFEEFESTPGKEDTLVGRLAKEQIDIIVIELETITKMLAEQKDDNTDVGHFRRYVVGRLMKRLLN